MSEYITEFHDLPAWYEDEDGNPWFLRLVHGNTPLHDAWATPLSGIAVSLTEARLVRRLDTPVPKPRPKPVIDGLGWYRDSEGKAWVTLGEDTSDDHWRWKLATFEEDEAQWFSSDGIGENEDVRIVSKIEGYPIPEDV